MALAALAWLISPCFALAAVGAAWVVPRESEALPVEHVEVWRPGATAWEVLRRGGLPAVAATTLDDGRIAVTALTSMRDDREGVLADVWDPTTGAWTSETHVVRPRVGQPSALREGEWFVILSGARWLAWSGPSHCEVRLEPDGSALPTPAPCPQGTCSAARLGDGTIVLSCADLPRATGLSLAPGATAWGATSLPATASYVDLSASPDGWLLATSLDEAFVRRGSGDWQPLPAHATPSLFSVGQHVVGRGGVVLAFGRAQPTTMSTEGIARLLLRLGGGVVALGSFGGAIALTLRARPRRGALALVIAAALLGVLGAVAFAFALAMMVSSLAWA